MLGVDTEFFYKHDESQTIIPALPAFILAGLPMSKVFKKIGCDIAPKGYDSLELPLPHSRLTEDGAAVETPCDPADEVDTLIANVREGVQAAWEVADILGVSLIAAPLVYLSANDIEQRPELRVLGCNPDIDVYGCMEGRPQQDPCSTSWRTGGGHIHFSLNNADQTSTARLVILCDCILGTADVLLEHSEFGRKRREMYGQPGKHRIQRWGIEYRTMSNVFMVHPEVAKAALSLARAVHQVVDAGFDSFSLIESFGPMKVIEAITECDLETTTSVFDSSIEALVGLGADVTGAALVKEISQIGGVVKSHGYRMGGWRNA